MKSEYFDKTRDLMKSLIDCYSKENESYNLRLEKFEDERRIKNDKAKELSKNLTDFLEDEDFKKFSANLNEMICLKIELTVSSRLIYDGKGFYYESDRGKSYGPLEKEEKVSNTNRLAEILVENDVNFEWFIDSLNNAIEQYAKTKINKLSSKNEESEKLSRLKD